MSDEKPGKASDAADGGGEAERAHCEQVAIELANVRTPKGVGAGAANHFQTYAAETLRSERASARAELAAEVRRLREDAKANRRDALDMESRWRGAESLCVSLKCKFDELEAEAKRLREDNAELRESDAANAEGAIDAASERDELRETLEIERMRLAACGVAAHGGDSTCIPEYESDALTATRSLREQLLNYQEGFKREEAAASAYRDQVGFMSAKLACVEAEATELIGVASQCLEMFDHDEPGSDEYVFAFQVQDAICAVQTTLRDPQPSTTQSPDLPSQVENGEK